MTRHLRRDGPFVIVLIVGVGLRVCTMVAYRPALFFSDSVNYLKHASPLHVEALRPIGYSILIAPVVSAHAPLELIPMAQHLLGLLLAVALYVFCLRKGVPRWGATLATVPILLDPLQLVLEQYVLSDLVFEVLVTTALLLVLARKPSWRISAVSGLLIGFAAIDRDAGLPLIVVVIAMLAASRCRPHVLAAAAMSFVIPVVSYAAFYDHQQHQFALEAEGSHYFYSRLAPIADCRGVRLSPVERSLCPTQPIAARPDQTAEMFNHRLPQWTLRVPAGRANGVLSGFDKAVVRAHPWPLLRSTLGNIADAFAPTRFHDRPGFPAATWLFHPRYWSLSRFYGQPWLVSAHLPKTSTATGPASFLTWWSHHIWTPGPLLALAAVAAASAALGLGRARWSSLRLTVVGLVGMSLTELVFTSLVAGPSWRYQLLQLSLLPAAAAVALTALTGPRSAPPPRRPWLYGVKRTITGRQNFDLALLIGGLALTAAVAIGGLAYLSRWASAATAILLGAATATLAATAAVRSLRVRPRAEALKPDA